MSAGFHQPLRPGQSNFTTDQQLPTKIAAQRVRQYHLSSATTPPVALRRAVPQLAFGTPQSASVLTDASSQRSGATGLPGKSAGDPSSVSPRRVPAEWPNASDIAGAAVSTRGAAQLRHEMETLRKSLGSEWQTAGRVDSRYEQILDAIVRDLAAGRYALPGNYYEKYTHPGAKVVGSGSNGRIFEAAKVGVEPGKHVPDSAKVAVKVTLAMYGAMHEVQMLRHCERPFASSASKSATGDRRSTGNTTGKRRVNLRDLYACLKAHSPRMPRYTTRDVFRQIVEVVWYLHRECGVTHGDLKVCAYLESVSARTGLTTIPLKLQNLLIDAHYTVKAADFSAMKLIRDGLVKRFAGAPMFGAPEALKGNFDGVSNDVWGMGVILYMMRFGPDKEPEFVGCGIPGAPQSAHSIQQEERSVQVAGAGNKGDLIWPGGEDADEELRDLLQRLLARDPFRRPMLEEILAHPFVSGAWDYPARKTHDHLPITTETTAKSTNVPRQAVPPPSSSAGVYERQLQKRSPFEMIEVAPEPQPQQPNSRAPRSVVPNTDFYTPSSTLGSPRTPGSTSNASLIERESLDSCPTPERQRRTQREVLGGGRAKFFGGSLTSWFSKR
ncbi:hypothetical protein HDU93_006387 [Gonapodya sp. JEL0774]|nr:hypothetical protein HDU93_006387 [Gonapodya sp. JEL0774]